MVMIQNYYHIKDKTLNLQGIRILSNFHIYSKIMRKKTRNVLGQL